MELSNKDKDEKVEGIIEKLSNIGNANLDEIIGECEKIYCNEYRHKYSRIFSKLVEIDNNISSEKNLGYLLTNIELLLEKSKAGNYLDSCKNGIGKFYDHVNLEISRIEYTKAIEENHRKDKEELSKNIVDTENSLVDLNEEIQSKLQDAQKDYISILGIFASIILTFVAGIAFSTSVLSNIHLASIYRLLIITIMIATMLVNSLYMLFTYLIKQKEESKTSVFDIFHLKSKEIKIFDIKKFNIVMAILIGVIIVAWLIDLEQIKNCILGKLYN
ncbi:hypothetical protein LJC13_00685 [Peptostreptococcaceae bacterium OttesenSCG-928-C18]|nr:hypothetical protein [Peptostreptococcaceae bacterium OttesenSCG-928-C18]